jgi:hypothetical protein
MRISIEQWAPDYGSPMGPDALEETQAAVDAECEVPVDEWAPRSPAPGTTVPDEIAFVDGVRRVEARVWIESDRGSVHQGICASYAAGVVRCNGAATVVDAQVRRSVFSDAPDLVPIVTRHGRFGVSRAPWPTSNPPSRRRSPTTACWSSTARCASGGAWTTPSAT